ncbi:MAG: sulfite exporter TauE/SafE family protein [Pseudomonadota bacterium]
MSYAHLFLQLGLPPMPLEHLAIILVAAFFGGIVTGAVGFGSGPLMMGVYLIVLSPKIAAPLMMFSALFFVPASLRTVWHAIQWRRIVPFALGALVGAPLGAFILVSVPTDLLKGLIGVILIGYCIVMLARRRRIVISPRTPLPDALVGVTGGLVGGGAAIPGVVWSLWTSMRGWSKEEQRAVYQPLNLATVTFAFASLWYAGLVTREVLDLALYVVPVTLVGVACGIPLYRRISEAGFRKLILALLAALGIYLVADVALGLR